jgi:molecular chaperone GrpE (heat shock protein)
MKDKKGKQAKETETEIEIEDLKKQIEENKSKYLRALADYQN